MAERRRRGHRSSPTAGSDERAVPADESPEAVAADAETDAPEGLDAAESDAAEPEVTDADVPDADVDDEVAADDDEVDLDDPEEEQEASDAWLPPQTPRSRRQRRHRRRRAARAARAAARRNRRRRRLAKKRASAPVGGDDPLVEEHELVGRSDGADDLFDHEGISDDRPSEPDDEPDRDDQPDEDSEPDDDLEPAGDIRNFFAPHPPAAPTLVDRLGRTGIVLLVAALIVAAGAVAVGFGWLDSARERVAIPEVGDDQEPPEDGWQPAILLATTSPADGTSDELRSLAVLATDRSSDEATILLLPTSTVTDVPGFGSFTLAEAWGFGGSSLVAVTVDNLLGLRIDGVLAVDETAWANWFQPAGGATIDVSSRIVPRDGPNSGTTRFEPGTQQLAPEDVADYLVVRGEGETELQSLPRAQQVLSALSWMIAEDPDALDGVVETARTLPGTATPERIRTVLGEVAEASTDDAATTITLPIVPLGSGPDEVYRPDEERLEALMDDRFSVSRDVDASGTRMAVQILNGNGEPGVGRDVADALADGRYRIVLTGNADRFTYRETRILVYSDDPQDVAAARDIQERLGVGIIERSGTPQSVVDVTIIVGIDFPPD